MAAKNNDIALNTLENLRMRLLDLTARNRLINFRHTKRGNLRIVNVLPNPLVGTLLTDVEIRFSPIPEPTRDELIEAGYIEIDQETGQENKLRKYPTAEEWAKYLGLSTAYETPIPSAEMHDSKRVETTVQTLLYPYELENRLRTLSRTAKSAIQEMGTNILYLVFGFLEWFDSDSSNNARAAPLFLLPVSLHKGRLNPETQLYEYTLSYSGEDIASNLSLCEKLRIDFAMKLPELNENTIPEAYFNDVQTLISGKQPQWRVRRFITLTLLNFNKSLMYLDLDPIRWSKGVNIIDHPIISYFLDGYNSHEHNEENSPLGFSEEYSIDEKSDIHTCYPLIEDADSSQHSALIDAIDGKNLVIEGPPGTGKSQTITNLIAAAIAQGKRVLFVAEKLAALEVVRRRLDAAGLSEFCLDLHSHRSQKRKVLEEIQSRLDKHNSYRLPSDIEVDIARYEELKTKLKTHVEQINRPWKNTQKTLHEIFMAATRYRETININLDTLRPEGYNGYNFDAMTQSRVEGQVKIFGKAYQAVVEQLHDNAVLQEHPWCGVGNTNLQFFDLHSVKATLEAWQDTLKKLNIERIQFAEKIGCELGEMPDSLNEISSLLTDVTHLSVLKGDEQLDWLPILRGKSLAKAQQYFKQFEETQLLYLTLANQVGLEVVKDLSLVKNFALGSKQLHQLVDQSVKLHELVRAVEQLTFIQEQLIVLDESLKIVCSSVGKKAAKHLPFTKAGLKEFKNFIELVTRLNPSYWKYRNTLFDNEALDELSPTLREELEKLRALHNELHNVFNLDNLPNQYALYRLKETLDAGGLFCWLKSNWYKARQKLFGYAVSNQVKHSTLYMLLEKAAEFVERRTKLIENPHYQIALGDYFKGLDTDLVALESLRSWYREIRQQYGIGFGQKVALGQAILDLPIDIAQGVRSLSEQGVQQQIDDLLDALENLKKVFAPFPGLQNDISPLIGKKGVVVHLLASLKEALRICGPLATHDTISVAQLADLVKSLDSLKNAVSEWENTNLDDMFFLKELNLKISINVDNSSSQSKLRHTLAVAAFVDQKVTNKSIQQYLYDQPIASSFDTLVILAEKLQIAMKNQMVSYEAFAQQMKLDAYDWMNQSGDQIEQLISRNDLALKHDNALQNWLSYIQVREQTTTIGLAKLVKTVEQRIINIQQIETAYQAGIYDVLAREILYECPELRQFSGRSQEALQEQFKEYDERLKELQCERIAWRIDQTPIPTGYLGTRVSEHSERRLLEHECGKKTRHIPIRELLNRARNALIALKPCFMMGPMSVARYLPPIQIFDLVVMDEASQIKPQDALGTIARGAQLVVVGDSKQLPPTNFFDRIIEEDDENSTTIEESESILDATRLIFPVRQLRWHYRSQHESLVAFSNYSFYEGNLVLFPSPNKEAKNYGIQYSRIQHGCFVNRRNKEEANIISEAIREHFRHYPKESLGVVAMNVEQRLQIEQTVESLAKEDIIFQKWLEEDEGKQAPLFIKNLENVQGDERDVIFISMTYGPQEPGGKVFQRFGPINSEVGWRRLNVLFTRSKKRMHIFSSMGSEDIILSETAKRGVRALRDFLCFCETRKLHKTDRRTNRAPDSDFEIAVMIALSKEGFECTPQFGVAGFFIDIAVLDPGNPGRYLMGIECDGATYHSAKSVRERDRLRQRILEDLGWRIRRIWSTDWFKNPYAEIQPIIRELNTLKTKQKMESQAEVASESDEIKEIIEKTKEYKASIKTLTSETGGLKEKLIQFDREMIRKNLPNTLENQRLLRPAMLEAFLEHLPCSQSEFLELIPSYLRQATSADEGQFLKNVLEIISTNIDTSSD